MPSLRLFFPVLLLTPLTTSLNLPLTFTQPSPNPSNSTPHLSLPLTLPPSANVPTPNVPIAHCTTALYWHLPTFDPKDCQDALNSMYVSAVKPYGNDDFEFVIPGAHPYHTMRVMETPRRYASGTCVVAIVMLASFSPGELPGVTPARRHETDIASFQSLWESAKEVDAGCVSKDATAMAGWAVDGARNSIGVFLWSARSQIDIRHFPFPRVPGVDGGSSA